MGVDCLILNSTDKAIIEAGNPYGSGAQLRPVQRVGGTYGNPDPVFILNVSVLTNPQFVAAQPYLSGLPIINSGAENFPPEIPSEDQ